jgi:hypothetical protein
MDWVPVVFIAFKVLVFGTGMFFAVKWHYDQGKKGAPTEKRASLRTAGKVALFAVTFVVLAVALLLATFAFGRKLGLDLSFP